MEKYIFSNNCLCILCINTKIMIAGSYSSWIDGVITHLELDILEYEVKRALRSITMNKASGGDGNPKR